MKSGRAAKRLETSELRIRSRHTFYLDKSNPVGRRLLSASHSGNALSEPQQTHRPRRISGSGFFHFYRRIVAFKNQLTQNLSVLHFCLGTLAKAVFQLAMLAPGSVFSHAPGQ